MAITISSLDGGITASYTCDADHNGTGPHTCGGFITERLAELCGQQHERAEHTRQLAIDGHIVWLAEQARIFADARDEIELRDACLRCPGTGMDPAETDYDTINNLANGQMAAILGDLADLILGRRS